MSRLLWLSIKEPWKHENIQGVTSLTDKHLYVKGAPYDEDYYLLSIEDISYDDMQISIKYYNQVIDCGVTGSSSGYVNDMVCYVEQSAERISISYYSKTKDDRAKFLDALDACAYKSSVVAAEVYFLKNSDLLDKYINAVGECILYKEDSTKFTSSKIVTNYIFIMLFESMFYNLVTCRII